MLVHGLVVAGLLAARDGGPEPTATPQVFAVTLIPMLHLPDARPDAQPRAPSGARPKARRPPKVPPPPSLATVAAVDDGSASEVGEGELAGAATAGPGGPGHACEMTRRLQEALRKDPLVQAAAAQADRGRAIRVWNGGWVPHPGQQGAGLAAVREAIIWEVGFAPAACRSEHVRGLVLLSLGDRPGAARIVVGAADWRWSDLLFARPGG